MTDPHLDILFVSGPDVEGLSIASAEILRVVEDVVRAQGNGQVTLDPRVQHVPDRSFDGHFNVLRVTVWPLVTTCVKIVAISPVTNCSTCRPSLRSSCSDPGNMGAARDRRRTETT